MSFLIYLWLPILLSALFVFILSGILHMALPWHKNDYKTVPDEDKMRDALRPFDVPPGDYMLPSCVGGDYNSPDFKAKLDAGPNWIMTVLPKGQGNMGATFVQWLVFLLLVGTFIAYIAVHALPGDAPARMVFRIVPGGLYLLDEPEAALSPHSQLAFLYQLQQAVAQGSQFIVATHSPIIASFPGAQIYGFDTGKVEPVAYDDLESVRLYRHFLKAPRNYLDKLFRE